MKLTKEQLEKAKAAKSVEELLALAKENGMELTEEEAAKYFAEWHKEGELSDDELENVSGGCGNDEPYTDIYCSHCGWTTKWSGYYPSMRDSGNIQAYGGPCPNCGAKYIYAGAYHG